jgi:hypothetical protein
MLRTILEPKRDGIVEGWRNLHSDELHRFYCSPDIIKMTKSEEEMDREFSVHGREEECSQVSGRKIRTERPLRNLHVCGIIVLRHAAGSRDIRIRATVHF